MVAVGSGSDNGGGESRVATMERVDAPPDEDDPFLDVKRKLIAGGAAAEGRQMAEAIALQAHAALDRLEDGPAIDGLRGLVAVVLERDH